MTEGVLVPMFEEFAPKEWGGSSAPLACGTMPTKYQIIAAVQNPYNCTPLSCHACACAYASLHPVASVLSASFAI
jgi:hypothetical protein